MSLWLIGSLSALTPHLLRFRHNLVLFLYLRIVGLLLHLLLSLHHNLLLLRVELASVDFARQVVGAKQNVHIISIENSLKLLVHGIDLEDITN